MTQNANVIPHQSWLEICASTFSLIDAIPLVTMIIVPDSQTKPPIEIYYHPIYVSEV